MADVRLTATNPEDSSVVPVACDASGRLLLEEQGQGPPGPEGPPGPKGDDGKDGDPFSGNFADDVTFGGSAEFAGAVESEGGFRATGNLSGTWTTGSGWEVLSEEINAYNRATNSYIAGEINTLNWNISKTGSATFPGAISSNSYIVSERNEGDGTICSSVLGSSNGAFPGVIGWGISVREKSGAAGLGCFMSRGGDIEASNSIVINRGGTARGKVELRQDGSARFGTNAESKITLTGSDGSATFASGKAGFTAEGYLWCTTRRGDTVVLDATSNGIGSWVEYTPTSRIEEIRDKLDANRPDTGEMPADTP